MICVAHCAVVDPQDRAYRAQRGHVTTWYDSSADVIPNIFTFSDPGEGAFIGWYTMAAGLDGFLSWAYNSWVSVARWKGAAGEAVPVTGNYNHFLFLK